MEQDICCPHCGHHLTAWEPPEPSEAERRAMWVADHVATWWFPAIALLAISTWVLVNVVGRPFEPYPVITFAVISAGLASIAALQGPLILTAQSRAAQRDRLRDMETLRVAVHNEAGLDRIEAKLDGVIADLADRSG